MKIPKPEFRLLTTGNPPSLQLTSDYIIILDDGLPIVQPKGFITDLASTPRLMWSVPGFSPMGPLAFGAIPHDFGYQYWYLLTYRSAATVFPEASMSLYERYPKRFGEYMPVFVGRPQKFFDSLLGGITREATGKRFVPWAAEKALAYEGHHAWDNYRLKGPTAYNTNSLDLPGVTKTGVKF